MYSASYRKLTFLSFATFLLFAGCSGESGSDPAATPLESNPIAASPVTSTVGFQNDAPVARISGLYHTRILRPGDIVEVDGSTSYDPNGDELTYQWTIVAKPQDSQAFLQDSVANRTDFVADVIGDYTVELIVSDHSLYSEPAYVTVSVSAHLPTKLNWGLHKDKGDGEDPDIAINNHGTIVQVFEDKDELSTKLYYRVGIAHGASIDWGGPRDLGNGLFPSVDINDAGIVVEIDGNWDLTYRVGIVDVDTKTIDFGSAHVDFESGRHASIAINNNNQVIEVHRSRACDPATYLVGGCQLLYRVGTAQASSRSVNFGSEHDNLPTGRRPAVDLNDRNDVIIVHEHWSQTDQSLFYQTATLNPDARSISRRNTGEYDWGAYPDIAIDNARRLVEVHKSQAKDTLWSALGYLNDSGTASIHDARPYSVGIATSVGMNDHDTFIASNDTRIDNLFYLFSRDFSHQKNTDRWMELTRTMHRKTLRDITLPGTHDSAAYELFTTFDGDPFDARGPDFFGIPVLDVIGTICDQPIPELYATWIGWACMIWVPTPVELNENAQDITTAQSRSINQQLNDGIRVFDIRVTERNGHFYVYHGLLGNRLEVVLGDVKEFIERTRGELVILEFSHLSTGRSTDDESAFTTDQHQALMNAIVSSLGDHMLKSGGSSRDELFGTQIRQLTADGSRVIVSYAWDEPPANTANADYFWGFGADAEAFYSVGNDVTAKLENRIPVAREKFDKWVSGNRTTLFKLIQTLTASKDVDDLEKFRKAVEEKDEIITGQVFFRRIVFQDYWPTLHKLSQDANQDLWTFLADGHPDYPNVIMVDFYEESDVVARAIELSARCDERAISGSLGVSTPRSWPPNHQMVPIDIDLGGLHSFNPDTLGGEIVAVEVMEPDRETGSDIYGPNNFEPDYSIDAPLTASLRSERSGQAEDRHYLIRVMAWDCSGDYEFATTVTVPHDKGD